MLGAHISHYRVTGKLGTGGMGVVYEAEDTRLPRKVALKFLPEEVADDPDAVRRFRREAETIALLNHANICTIYDIGDHEGRAFIAMECVDGVNLKTYMARKTLDTAELVDIALQVTQALEVAHDKGIVHRDIKPGNIVVTQARQVKVLDFGLAKRFRVPETGGVGPDGSTIPGRPLGTANYMAPERILQLPLDPRSDLFSMGVVIFEMATGRLPFGAASPPEIVTNVRFMFGLALGYITLAEQIDPKLGLGFLIENKFVPIEQKYMLLFVIAFVAFSIDLLLRTLQRGAFGWRKDL